MAFKIPEIGFGGKRVKGALEQVLIVSDSKPVEIKNGGNTSRSVTPARNDLDLSKFVLLPRRDHMIGYSPGTGINNYSYPDLLVSMERSHQNKNWNQSWKALRDEGALMLTIRQYADLVTILKTGDAFDGNGNQIPLDRVGEIYADITEVRNPWRAEWLDARFLNVGKGKNKVLSIAYHNLDKNGVPTEVIEPVSNVLMEDRLPGISLDSWLTRSNYQGLPEAGSDPGQLYYWHPRDGNVARFFAYSRGGLA